MQQSVQHNFNVTLTGTHSDFNNYETINANNFNVTLTGKYSSFYNRNSATINADNFNVTAGRYFSNSSNATINANDLTILRRFFLPILVQLLTEMEILLADTL